MKEISFPTCRRGTKGKRIEGRRGEEMESVNDTKRRIREKVRMETQKREIKNRRLKGRHALMDQLSLGICGVNMHVHLGTYMLFTKNIDHKHKALTVYTTNQHQHL